MKPHTSPQFISLLLLGAFCLAATDAWARLPKAIQASGVVQAVDHDTKTLILKAGKEKKPLVLDWNKDTEFIKNGQPTTAAWLSNGVAVVIHYKNVSFRNPLLKKASWESAP